MFASNPQPDIVAILTLIVETLTFIIVLKNYYDSKNEAKTDEKKIQDK